jgi:hypothetical protein
MKKKIRDLTEDEFVKLQEKHGCGGGCKDCPFLKIPTCAGIGASIEMDPNNPVLDKEIEID